MITVTIPSKELYDNEKEEFIYIDEITLKLEHSLISLSEWEAKWKKPFLNGKNGKTDEELRDYIRCMTINKNVPYEVYSYMDSSIIKKIVEYIEDPMTATWFSEPPTGSTSKRSKEIVTSEVIYYRMIINNIPFDCRKWHLNRLLTLIRVCDLKNSPPKKMGKREAISQQRSLNEARRRALGTSG